VVAVSTGNHGRGLAYAAKQAGVRAVVCMSNLVPANKVEAIRALGAEIRIVGRSQDEAQAEVDRLVAEQGMTMLPPFDHPDVIAGQGTLGLELIEDLPELETVLVPLSGGGLIAGIALAIKTAKPDARVVGITMRHGAAMYESLAAGRPVEVEEVESLADSLGGGIGQGNRYTFRMVRQLVDDCLLVDEDRIAAGIRHAYFEERQVIEGGAAVGISALLDGMIERPGVTVVLLSGANIDMTAHAGIIGGAAR
jgi:threonine dehydratase